MLLGVTTFELTTSNEHENDKTTKSFGHWSISKECFDLIRSMLPPGKVILEFGSGWTSGELSKHYTVYSVEHNKKWLNRYNTNYIYAPVVDDWYDKIVLDKLPKKCDLLLIDGPPSRFKRTVVLQYLDHLDLEDTIIIVDDIDRKPEYDLLIELVKTLDCELEIYFGAGRQFAVIRTLA